MLSVLRSNPGQQQSLVEPKLSLKTALGFGGHHKDLNSASPSKRSPFIPEGQLSHARRSVDTVTNYKPKRKSRAERASLTDATFFEDDLVTVDKSEGIPSDMKNGIAPLPRRGPIRVEGQDGPWAISVAETPHDTHSYSLYVKTPTHNLTLTRTAVEIVELHDKIRDTVPGIKLPVRPIDPSILPTPPPKRKSTFLSTLSRLASPTGKSSSRHISLTRSPLSTTQPTSASNAATPMASPSKEANDPFSSFGEGSTGTDGKAKHTATNSMVTTIAAYLTTLANDPTIRQSRVWKRFMRVRTDDLQSVRAERAIKRVRSDLAAHGSTAPAEMTRSVSQVLGDAEEKAVSQRTADSRPESLAGSSKAAENDEERADEVVEAVVESPEKGVEEAKDEIPSEPSPVEATVTTPITPADTLLNEEPEAPSRMDAQTPVQEIVEPVEDAVGGRSTPVPAEAEPSSRQTRVPRSQSADPASRVSRIYAASTPSSLHDGTSSQVSITGDESSISTTGRVGRKKRSKSTDPNAGIVKRKSERKVVIDDFEMMRVLGKGCAGKVLLVRHRTTGDVFALKAITKRHVLAHQELQHTLTEQAVLKRMAAEGTDPFVVKLWWSFHDKENLFLVMDFHPGGDLATQLARWGLLGRDRARFYAAEIVEGVEGLHAAGVIYRDLKPENILIGADGHIVLTDFGLSKEFPRRTSAITAPPTPSGTRTEFLDGAVNASPPWMKVDKDFGSPWTGANDTTSTFCGTAEYLAPEVIQGLPYSYEVDWWSFGTMLYEMLTGITPFWADNHSDMYYRVLQDELQFPEGKTMDQDTKSLIRGLLQRNPALRMKEPRIKKHPYFSMIDWSHVYHKRYIPPYIPPIDPSNASDTQNFDDTFLDMDPVINDENDNDHTDTDPQTDTDRTDGEDSATTPSQSRSPSVHASEGNEEVDLFDGYSFKGRHSVIIDDDEGGDGEESSEEDEEDEVSVLGTELDHLLPENEQGVAVAPSVAPVEEVPEPKTPEAEVAPSPELEEPAVAEPKTPVETRLKEPEETVSTPPPSEDVATEVSSPISKEPEVSAATPLAAAPSAPVPAAPAPVPVTQETITLKAPVPRSGKPRNRREKSGIPALDRALEEDGLVTEREEEDDDWDFVETNVNEERNGAKGTSLFARGVVDRYRLAVFRKSTPRRANNARNFSGLSDTSSPRSPGPASPTPAEKRRGRNPGLSFRRNPKEFLRTRSPSSRQPSGKSSLPPSSSTTLSTATGSNATSTAVSSPSLGSTLPVTPSLRSKESAVSMGSPSSSSEQSLNGDTRTGGLDTAKVSAVSVEEKHKTKGLKKYKEGAEKVFSMFQSPR